MRIFHSIPKTADSIPKIAEPVRNSVAALALSMGIAMLAGCDLTQDDDPNERGNKALRPELREATDARVASLTRPEGFQVQVFARDLGHARMIAAAPDGWVYLTCPQQGQVKMLRDADGDGDADSVKVALDGLEGVHGIAIKDDFVYLATVNKVMRSQRSGDGTLSAPETLYDSLPSGGQHGNRTLAFGPDGLLYVSVGSSCNACRETDSLHATLLRMDAEGNGTHVFAGGLRNTIGFGWHPDTKAMWGMDHGSDGLGDNQPPEELNRLQEGRNYGWPYVFAKRQIDPLMDNPPGTTKAEFADGTEPSVLEYQAHSAPIGMAFYDSTRFPEHYRKGAFVAMRGSWNRIPATGYKLVFLPFTGGEPQAFEDFVTGFLIEDGTAQFGRLAGVAVAADGNLLFTDDANGVMYRVSYAP
jgi:glucose/arabinose dehydrogenase